MIRSKMTCPKWHLGQVGHGGQKAKKPYGGFLIEIISKTSCDFCSGGCLEICRLIY
jgi:hypothetical protein